MFSIQTLLPVYLLRADIIVIAVVTGLWFSRWWWVAIAAVVFAILEHAILYGFVIMIFGRNAPGAKPSTHPEVYLIDIGAVVIAVAIWATVFFLLKVIGKRLLNRARGVS